MSSPQIQDYGFGKMTVNGETYTQDLILLPDGVKANWWREEGHNLNVVDLRDVFEASPEVLVVGTGAYGRMKVSKEARQEIEAAGISLRIARTGQAWQLYNDLRDEKQTVGAFHLTC